MAGELTTTARVRERLTKDDPAQDGLLQQIIVGVSLEAEQIMGRLVEEKARTELYDVDRYDSKVFLNAYGQLAVTSVHNSSGRVYDSTTILATTDYTVEAETGLITTPKRKLYAGHQAVQVIYTGGLGTDVDDIVANGYGDIVHAVTIQVVADFQRAADPHLQGYTDPAGGTTLARVEWLPRVLRALNARASKVFD